jgi:hypothetical protein
MLLIFRGKAHSIRSYTTSNANPNVHPIDEKQSRLVPFLSPPMAVLLTFRGKRPTQRENLLTLWGMYQESWLSLSIL